MLTVHHLDHSRSHRVLWLLEELGVEYELKEYQRDRRTLLAPPELREVHPLGKSPVITDDGRVFAESGAILEYLVDAYGHGRLRPEPGTDAFYRHRYWMHYAEGSAATPLLVKLITGRVAKSGGLLKPVTRKIAQAIDASYTDPAIATHMGYIESELGKAAWFAGDEFTSADIQMSYPVLVARSRVETRAPFPNMDRFIATIQARRAYQAAVARGGPPV